MQFITDFGDAGVILPVFLAVTLTLLLLRRMRIARAWALALGCVVALTVGLKLLGYVAESVTPALAQFGIVTPSGHVAASAASYGGLLGLLLRGSGSPVRRALLSAALVALVIGVTRVLLGEHTVGEVVVGATVGVLGAGLFACLAGERIGRAQRAALAGITLGAALLCHGTHASPEGAIRAASGAVVRDWFSPGANARE